jgi:N-acetylmuramoyl-L-alanine amidase
MKVAIDPGHGMSNRQLGVYDPGGVHTEAGFRFEEAEIALRYALTLREALRCRGSASFLTREDARDHAPVGERAGNARLVGASALISLHLNAVEDQRASGVEVLHRGEASRPLAQALQTAIVAVAKLRNRGIKPRDDLAVLRFPGPAALVELGFIGNDADRGVLVSPARRYAICEAIAEVVLAEVAAGADSAASGRAADSGKRRRRAQRAGGERSSSS